MRIRTLLPASIVLLASFTAKADTTYNYSGQSFSSALSPLTTADSLSGSFVIANQLAPNSVTFVNSTGSPAGAIDPLSWSFTDGVTTFNQSNSLFDGELITDSTGDITYWQVGLLGPVGGVDFTFLTASVATPRGFYDVISVPGAGVSNSTSEGSWSVGSAPAATPEPSSLAMFGTAAIGFLGALKKRKTVHSF